MQCFSEKSSLREKSSCQTPQSSDWSHSASARLCNGPCNGIHYLDSGRCCEPGFPQSLRWHWRCDNHALATTTLVPGAYLTPSPEGLMKEEKLCHGCENLPANTSHLGGSSSKSNCKLDEIPFIVLGWMQVGRGCCSCPPPPGMCL